MKIRKSVENDKTSIKNVHLDSFGKDEGKTISQLAIDLLENKTVPPVLSLVAQLNNEIVGNIIFSSVKIEGVENTSVYILAPLAVATLEQKKGIGSQLIIKGLKILKERGVEIVLVYGDPNYYRHTGFKSGHNLSPPYKLQYPEEAWMAQELVENALSKTQGKVKCSAPLRSPEFW